ncbi:dihydrofolate reductase family protein [Phenylobacterium sp.]|uniref:dihydrofolate reductase family protein n=1 Tax=Phenylobacterium sp. TaxID=1871053 RepID=UPI002BC6DB5E|nr:dihydrofolate reductase family protein [Phenylobacterium sp.]HLZ75103.1 dihydrofolate reductase family protein [Phenylobacterium sp.]
MGKLIFGMMQSLDGYVDHLKLPPPGVALHPHFNDHVRGLAGSLLGRRMYEIMCYWDEDQAGWDAVDHDFAAAWRAQPKWVVSRSLTSVGANATLVADDVERFVRRLKAEVEGDIDVAGPVLAGSLTDLGLIDEYRLYLRPFVLGGGQPYFAAARPPLRLVATDLLGEDTVRLTFVPA